MVESVKSSVAPRQPVELRWPSWTTLRMLGNSLPVKATAVVPFIGYLILFNQQLAPYFQIALQHAGLPRMSGPTETVFFSDQHRLYMTYFGLTFIGIGSFLYQTVCPQTIRRFPTDYDFIKAEQEVLSDIRIASLTEAMRKHSGRSLLEVWKVYESLLNAAQLTHEHLLNDRTYAQTFREKGRALSLEILSCYYFMEDRSMPVMRIVTFIGMVSGFSLLLLPSSDIFISIVSLLIKEF